MGLDGELGDHGERVGPFDDHLGLGLGGGQVTPAVAVLAQHVAARQGVAGTERRLLHEWRVGGQGRADGGDRGQLLVRDPHGRRAGLGRIERLGRDRRDRVAVVFRLARREHRAVPELGPEARHRLRQVRRGEHEAHAGYLERLGRVDAQDASPGAGEGHELDVQGVLEVDVGRVRLVAGDAVAAATARRGAADGAAHCGATLASGVAAGSGPAWRAVGGSTGCVSRGESAARSTASMICS